VAGHPASDRAAGAPEIGFEAPDQATANAALASLEYRAPASGDTADAAQEGRWEWVAGPEAGDPFWDSGPPLGFSSWGAGEPDDGGGAGEDHARLAPPGGSWGDAADAGGAVTRYVVEYGGMTGETPLERASASVGVTVVGGPPGVATEPPLDVGAGAATLAATVRATGGATVARLAYGTDPALAGGSTLLTAPAELAGLSSFRLGVAPARAAAVPRRPAARARRLRPGVYRIAVRAVDEYGREWTAARHVRFLRP
jgi:hypothetical protein